jgi:hypothetical protein
MNRISPAFKALSFNLESVFALFNFHDQLIIPGSKKPYRRRFKVREIAGQRKRECACSHHRSRSLSFIHLYNLTSHREFQQT